MKRSAAILNIAIALASLAAFTASAWLWNRSRTFSDLYYRYEPVPGGSAMRGVASIKGALVFGSVTDSNPSTQISGYRHDVWTNLKSTTGTGGTGSMLQARPDRKVSALGFGVSDGELTLNIPFAFMLPKRTYHAVYIPYYSILLLAAIQPLRLAFKFLRGKNLIPHLQREPHSPRLPNFSPGSAT